MMQRLNLPDALAMVETIEPSGLRSPVFAGLRSPVFAGLRDPIFS
ncbi:MAG: hypothetical protein WBZ29_07675 [Methanocella sp.]